MNPPDRPIFVVGHARAGSTALAAILNWHSRVGPKPPAMRRAANLAEFLEGLRSSETHLDYSIGLERKDFWFKYFPGEEEFTHMGLELSRRDGRLLDADAREIRNHFAAEAAGQRLLVKSPSSSFWLRSIRQAFPDAKVIVLYRRGEEVVASWGRRHYGFGKSFDWGSLKSRKLSYLRGIKIFSRKWAETVRYVDSLRGTIPMHFVRHEDLFEKPQSTLRDLLGFAELPWEPYLDELELSADRSRWRTDIPRSHHWLLRTLCYRGNRTIDRCIIRQRADTSLPGESRTSAAKPAA